MSSSWPVWASRSACRRRVRRTARRDQGQSLVEFALILPVLLLLVLGGIDFGRVFLGWVSLNNTARIAANYAASNATLMAAGNPAAIAAYNDLVQQDATATNCQPPDPIPLPTFTPNAGLGGSATVRVTCNFGILTPVISSILGNAVEVSASAVFPVRTGVVANEPGGGPVAPVAAFNVSPASGDAPLDVSFNNVSTGSPTTYAWDYENDGIVDSTAASPPDHVYSVPGTYTPTLTVSNGLVSSTASRTITVTTPPGPIADFIANPQAGTAPLTVSFTNTSTGAITGYAWDFDGDGVTDSAVEDPPNRTYAAGTWNVSLTVTDGLGLSSTTVKTITVSAVVAMCQVPNFKGSDTSDAVQAEWTAAGFQTTVIFNPSRPPEYRIKDQSLKQNTDQPCATAVITVSK